MSNESAELLRNKADFTDVYNHPSVVRYYQELLKEKGLAERCEIIAKYTERNLLPLFTKWNEQLARPLQLVDLLCAFGNDTLSVANFYHREHFDKMWGSEDTCYDLSKPRQFPVETFGCDISSNACAYAKKAGIFDDTLAADLNNLTDSQKTSLEHRCKNANILLMNSFIYLNDGIFEQLLNWFTAGTDPGILILGFVYPYAGSERCRKFKLEAMEKLNFFNSLPSKYRLLDESEIQAFGNEFGTWEQSYNDCWMLTRKAAKD